MTIAKREQQILASMSALQEQTYTNVAMLDELLKFEKELVRVTFAEDHVESLRLCDVLPHLEVMDAEVGGIAHEQIQNLREMSNELEKLIKTSLSGASGEKKVFNLLETLNCPSIIIRNAELAVDDQICEIDFIVITPRLVFCIEVKNAKNDIILDANGNLVRAIDKKMFERNLGDAVRQREYMLRSLLSHSGILSQGPQLEIKTYIVSANPQIVFTNNFPYIDNCCVTHIPYIIENYNDGYRDCDENMELIRRSIVEACNPKEYPVKFDVDKFKRCFARIVATLEFAKDSEPEPVLQSNATVEHNNQQPSRVRDIKTIPEPSRMNQRITNARQWLATSSIPRYACCVLFGALSGYAIAANRKH